MENLEMWLWNSVSCVISMLRLTVLERFQVQAVSELYFLSEAGFATDTPRHVQPDL